MEANQCYESHQFIDGQEMQQFLDQYTDEYCLNKRISQLEENVSAIRCFWKRRNRLKR